MKITGYRNEAFVWRWRNYGDANNPGGQECFQASLLFLETDAGLTGIVPGSTDDELFSVVEGRDPRGVTGLWKQLNDQVFKQNRQAAIGPLDNALWDLKAKANDEPVWRTFGAKEGRVKVYASGLDMPLSDDKMAAYYREMASLGINGGKLKVGLDIEDDRRRLGIMRDCLKPAKREPYLMIDSNEFWSPKQAIRKVARLEEDFDLQWVEEPARRWDWRGLRQVSQAVRAAVATGENLHHIGEHMHLIANEAVDVVQLGPDGCAGLTGGLYVAGMAHGHEKPVSGVTGPGQIVAHLLASLPNHSMTELKDLKTPPCWTIPNRIEDGWLLLGDAPGFGIEVDEAKLCEMQANPLSTDGEAPRRKGAGLF
ncbi:MAG: mandelate racemase/muconate lactonizing enzyme family protein [Verrucomicrobiota bacterium]